MNVLNRPGRAAFAVLLALASVALVACGDDKKPTTPPATAGGSQATPARPDPKTLLNDAADKLDKTTSFHFLLEHERGYSPIVLGLQMTRAEGDVVKPDKLRADVDAQRGVKLKLKVVAVGDRTQITNPFVPSMWQDLPSGTKAADIFDPGAGTIAALRNVKDPQITGEDTIDGKPTWKVDGNVDAATLSQLATLAQPGYTAKGTAWIGKDTKEVYKVRLEGPLGKDDAQDVVRVLTLSKYNDNISITPVP